MPIRFSTEAANADVLGEDADTKDTTQAGMSRGVGADSTPRDRFARSPKRDSQPEEAPAGEAKPGKDINAAGFVKDKDAAKP
jgi:hypothetical protein